MPESLVVLIASYLEPEYVAQIRAVEPRIEVLYDPSLLAAPRYVADHGGGPLNRTPEQEARWREMLARADVLFDFDRTHLNDLTAVAPRLRWVQATSAGSTRVSEMKDRSPTTRSTGPPICSGVRSRTLVRSWTRTFGS